MPPHPTHHLTRPRTNPTLVVARHGAKAIYAEKAMCASVEEANAIHECLVKHGVHLNMGTNR